MMPVQVVVLGRVSILRRRDTQHNNNQHNDSQHSDTYHKSKQKINAIDRKALSKLTFRRTTQ
jgi:hypothetical protein